MDINDPGEWRELFDVALFEPNRVKLRQRIKRARLAINTRLEALMHDQGEARNPISERIALSDALITLSELQRIVYARKPGTNASGQQSRTAG